ncbi:ABC transporter permease [Candidatus Binatia bacterium]|nr:ABC transporter permease [Candidatus Binatia bacterium]
MWMLRELSWPHLRHHRARTLLAGLGIALGVGAIIATDAVTDAVLSAFRRTVDATTGRANLHVTGDAAGVPGALVDTLGAVAGVRRVTAVSEGFVGLADSPGDMLAVFGFDLLGENPYETQLPRSAIELRDEIEFLNQTDSIVLPRPFAERHGLELGGRLDVMSPRGRRTLVVRGLADANGPAALFGGAVAMMDLPAAQRLLDTGDKVDRIEIEVAEGADAETVRNAVGAQVDGVGKVESASAQRTRAEELLFSFRVTLALAGLVGAIVGLCIIYHTTTVSVAQRRRDIALLHALGVSRRRVFTWLATEAIVLAAGSSALGLVLGQILARAAMSTVGTVVTAWIRLPIESATASATTLLVGFTVGIVTAVAATLLAARSIVTEALAGALRGMPTQRGVRVQIRASILVATGGLLAAAFLIWAAPSRLGFTALVTYIFVLNSLVLVSVAWLSPALAAVLGALASVCGGWSRGTTALLAGGSLGRNPAGAIAVVAAIVMGLGWTLADAALVQSLQRSWLDWLDGYYRSDLVVTAGTGTVSFVTSPAVADEVVAGIAALPGVREVQGVRVLRATYDGGPIVVEGVDPATRGLPRTDGDWSAIAAAFWAGDGVVVNEKLAHRRGVRRGDTLELATPSGERSFRVLGVVSDFQNGDLGGIGVTRSLYRDLWRDPLVNAVFVWVESADRVRDVRTAIQAAYAGTHGLYAVTAAEFRANVAELVVQVFSLTYVLMLVALTISFVGVTNFLLAAILDRRGELNVLGAVGLTPTQIGAAIVTEGALLGAVGVVAGLAAGTLISRIIVEHSVPMVNGWRFQYLFPTPTAVQLCLGALLLSAAAGLMPARLATRRNGRAVRGRNTDGEAT